MNSTLRAVDGSNVYLEPDASYTMAQKMAKDGGEPISIGPKTLNKRLREQGHLLSTEGRRGTATVRRVLQGARRCVLHLRAASLSEIETAQSAHEPGTAADHGADPRADSSAARQDLPTGSAQESTVATDSGDDSGQIGQIPENEREEGVPTAREGSGSEEVYEI